MRIIAKKFIISTMLALLCLAAVFSLFGCEKSGLSGVSSTVFIEDGIQYMVTDEEKATVKLLSFEPESKKSEVVVRLSKEVAHDQKVYLLTEIGDDAFFSSDVTFVHIPDSVVKIGDGAFLHSGIQGVYSSGEILSIGYRAFSDCLRLREVSFAAAHPPALGDKAFTYFDRGEKVYKTFSSLRILVPSDSVPEYVEEWRDLADSVRAAE